MRTSPGAFVVLKVDVLNMFTSPGAFEILCQVFKMNCEGFSYCQISNWLKFDDDVSFSLAWLSCSKDVLSSSKMMMQMNSHGS